MAVAVCIKCGELKEQALGACAACEFTPESSLERAQSMVATSHHLPQIKLDKLSRDIKRERPVNYPFDLLAGYMDTFEGRVDQEQPIRIPGKGCAWLVFVGVLAGLGMVVLLS